MVNRSKISKEISRAAGGGAGRNVRKEPNVRRINVPKGKTRGNINRPGDWIPNPKYRPGDLYSGEPPMIRNPERKKDAQRARLNKERQARELAAAKAKARKRTQEKAVEKAREKPKPVTTVKRTAAPTAVKPAPQLAQPETRRAREGRKEGAEWQSKREFALPAIRTKGEELARLREAAGRRGRLQSKKQRTAYDMQQKQRRSLGPLSPSPTSPRDLYKAVRQNTPLEELMRETFSDTPTSSKTGGKVSKSKGGTIKKMHGGKLHTKTTHKKKTKKTYDNHHGGKLVASLYD